MKKNILLGFVVLLLFAGCFNKSEEVEEMQTEEEVVYTDAPTEDGFSYADFLALFAFKNGGSLSQDQDRFFFQPETEKDDGGVIPFNAREFYEANKNDEAALRNMAKRFENVRYLAGTKPIERELSEELQFHNIFHTMGNQIDLAKHELYKLYESGEATDTQIRSLSYAESLFGNYDEAEAIIAACKKSKNCPIVTVNVSGKVSRGSKGVPKADITVLNTKETIKTDKNGEFSIQVESFVPNKVRIKAIKKGYADAYEDFYVVVDAPGQKRNLEFQMEKAHGSLSLDLNNPDLGALKKAGLASVDMDGEDFLFKTDVSQYRVRKDQLVKADGKPYTGKVNVYFYEFGKDSNIDDLLSNDSVDELSSYFGSFLKTFGMPFVQFFTDKGEELFIDRSDPVVLTSRITEMQALRSGSDGVYAPVTDELIQTLYDYSQNSDDPYPITKQYLQDNFYVSYPQWWILDRKRGRWNAEPSRVTDLKGGFKTIFYSIDLEGSYEKEKQTRLGLQ